MRKAIVWKIQLAKRVQFLLLKGSGYCMMIYCSDLGNRKRGGVDEEPLLGRLDHNSVH